MRVTQRGEFFGTKAELERQRRRADAQIVGGRYVTLSAYAELYVDGAGTIYSQNQSGKFTLVVGQCVSLTASRERED